MQHPLQSNTVSCNIVHQSYTVINNFGVACVGISCYSAVYTFREVSSLVTSTCQVITELLEILHIVVAIHQACNALYNDWDG